MNSTGRAPRLDLLLGGGTLQPHIHDGIVDVKYRGRLSRFHVFVKNHRYLPVNQAVHPYGIWRGDIIVMRKGSTEDFVNLRVGDARLADAAVRESV